MEPVPLNAARSEPPPKLKIYFLPNLLTAANLFCGFVALTKIVDVDKTDLASGNFDQIYKALGLHLAGVHLRFVRWPRGAHGRARKSVWPRI